MARARRATHSDSGFTLSELLVTMVVVSIIAVLATSGWFSYLRASEHRGSAHELASFLRNAQQRSLAEAVRYCVAFTSDRTYTLHKGLCSDPAVGNGANTSSSRVTLQNPDFTTPGEVTFLPRGAATAGSVELHREGSSRIYTVSVEGLTGRVSLDD